jgi:hypothetical protein
MDTKPCRSCCEEINASATKCPYCQMFQSRWIMWLPLLAVITFLGIASIPFMQLRSNREVQFEDAQQLLRVTDVSLSFEPPAKPPAGVNVLFETHDAWLYCTIRNDSDHDWDGFEFLVEFRDANGDRLDLNNLSEHSTVRAHSELEIRLQCRLAIDPTKVAETLVTITNANHDRF